MRREIMKSKISICILLCLTVLASGMASAQGEYPTSVPAAGQGASLASGLATGQSALLAACPQYGQAAAEGTYGTKVKAGDSDVGLPLSNFAPIGLAGPQNAYWVSYWDINSNGLYDDQDVPYLQFGSANIVGQRFVRANNIRLVGWGSYPAGSYVKPGDSDMGQPLGVIAITMPNLPSWPFDNFYYMDVEGGAGYDLGDPVYLKVLSPPFPIVAGTNDIRITANAGFPAGSKVSLNDPDAGRPLTLFNTIALVAGGPVLTAPFTTVGQLLFFNANGNVLNVPASSPIFDDGDKVYFHIGFGAAAVVSPNDIRLY
jgi:hypothetical protein